LRSLPSKPPERRQHFLKSASRAARTQIVAPELLGQFVVAVHDAVAAPHLRLGRITPASACARVRKDGSRSKSSRRMMASYGSTSGKVVRAVGFEPTTSWFQARSAAGLRYALKVDHPAGLEPATSRSATGCSRPLSYGWIGNQVSGIRDQGSGIRYQGSGIRDQGSGIKNKI
jgi:hypothetical protein